MTIQDVFSIDAAQNKAMKIERLRSKAPPFMHPLSIEELIGDNGVPPNSMTAGQLIVQPKAKASTSTPTTNPAIGKRKKQSLH